MYKDWEEDKRFLKDALPVFFICLEVIMVFAFLFIFAD